MVQELEKRTRIDVADVLRGLAVMGHHCITFH